MKRVSLLSSDVDDSSHISVEDSRVAARWHQHDHFSSLHWFEKSYTLWLAIFLSCYRCWRGLIVDNDIESNLVNTPQNSVAMHNVEPT